MKLKKFLALFMGMAMGFSALSFVGCGTAGEGGSDAGSVSSEQKEEIRPAVFGVDYEAPEVENIEEWVWENRNASGVITNKATGLSGIVRSPYFTGLKANGTEVSVYSERTAAGPHSFAYIDLDGVPENARFVLDIEFVTASERSDPVVLPESAGVEATVSGKKVNAKIFEYGVYTFTFDRDGKNSDGSECPLTLMVKPKENLVIPEGYTKREFEPGTYTYDETAFTEGKTVYYFKKGRYSVEGIKVPSDSVFYFEEGTVISMDVLTRRADGTPECGYSVSGIYAENVRFLGRPCFDFSNRNGSNGVYAEDKDIIDAHSQPFNFDYGENIELSGINVANSGSWTCCFSGCKNVTVRDLILIGYRTFSDGVMISDCENVSVSGCFVRTGDDAMEVKSTTGGSVPLKNVVFEYNAVWTDKGIAYGSVYETSSNRQGVVWRHNSVGFALANWSEHLGCTTISMEGSGNTTDSDLHFEDIEIYASYCPVTTIVLHNGGTVRDVYFENIRAKYIDLRSTGAGWYRGAIDFVVYNSDKGEIEDFAIKNIYFDNIDLAGTKLTPENKKELITTKFAAGFDEIFRDYRSIRVNTLTK